MSKRHSIKWLWSSRKYHRPPQPTPLARAGAVPYSITMALPTGLNFDPTTRLLSGTATVTQAATTYTLTDADGDQGGMTFSIAVVAEPTLVQKQWATNLVGNSSG